MIDKTLKELEERIKASTLISKDKKAEFLILVSKLKSEIGELAKTKAEEAESIAAFTKLSAYEATRRKKNPNLLELSLKGLSHSVKEFEVSHPKLVEGINAIATMLANMGI